MKSSLPDRHVVRQYLLGRLDEQKELESDLSEGILNNDDLLEMVESIEDEIIEEYLDGALDPADKDAAEKYFLQPTERKEKLRFAKLLRHRFETRRGDVVESQPSVAPTSGHVPSQHAREAATVLGWSTSLRAHWQVVALILLAVLSLTYIAVLRKNQPLLVGGHGEERQRSANLTRDTPLLQPSVILTLVSDRSRSTGTQIPRIGVNPSTQRVIVEIALPSGASGPHDIHLETKRERGSTWSATLLPLVSPSGDARLMFDVPAQSFESGVWSFVVSSSRPQAESRKYYDFHITVTK